MHPAIASSFGSEVRRVDIPGGAMLYDASRSSKFTADWFEPGFWRDSQRIEGTAQGRGQTLFVDASGQRLAVRHYWRGGPLGRFIRDRYVWKDEAATRPFAEWRLTYILHRAGLPVPVPIAARYRRHGMTYSGDFITERLHDTTSVSGRLASGALPISTWVSIGRCLRRFHDFGLCHADLTANNILLGPDDAVYLLDFDRGRLRKRGWWSDGNLVRLRRSLDKITLAFPPIRFTEPDWHSLLAGYRAGVSSSGAASVGTRAIAAR